MVLRRQDSSIGFGAPVRTNMRAVGLTNVVVTSSLLESVESGHLVAYGLIPEFIGRFPILVSSSALNEDQLLQFKDDSECSVLSCLLSLLRPAKIIEPIKILSPETEKVPMRQTRRPIVKEIYRRINNQSGSSPLNESITCATKDGLPEVLSELMDAGKVGSYAISALGGTLFYLKKAFLDESLLRFAMFELLPCSEFNDLTKKPYMILDATALDNLEVFENSVNGDTKGTLYDQLNRCVTALGKRLLKSWLVRPLFDIKSIKERQEAVAGVKVPARTSSAPPNMDEQKRAQEMSSATRTSVPNSEAVNRGYNFASTW